MDLPPLVDRAIPFDARIEIVYERRDGKLSVVSVGVRPLSASLVPMLRLADVERVQIAAALERTAGKRAAAARLLGISERNLYRKIHRYGLDTAHAEQ
jgi:DNA-binding NtrC family response regulator